MTEPKDALEAAAPGKPVGAPVGEAAWEPVGETAGVTVRDPVPAWPTLPARLPSASGQATGPETRDPAVDALLERLGTLSSIPVSGHGEAYAALHDELLEALNADGEGPTSALKTFAGQTSPGQGNAATAIPDHPVDQGPHDDEA